MRALCLELVRRVAAVEKAEAEKLQVVMAAQGDAEAKYLQGQAWRLAFFSSFCCLLPAHSLPSQCLHKRLTEECICQ